MHIRPLTTLFNHANNNMEIYAKKHAFCDLYTKKMHKSQNKKPKNNKNTK